MTCANPMISQTTFSVAPSGVPDAPASTGETAAPANDAVTVEANPTRPREPRVPFRIKLAFGLPMFFVGAIISMMLNWMPFFYADVVKVHTAIVAPVTVCIVAAYAMSQPIVGFLSDSINGHSRFCVKGMRRPFMLALCGPAAIGHSLGFHPPSFITMDDPKGEGSLPLTIYCITAGCMASMSVGGIEVMLQSLAPILAKTYDQRSELAAVDAACYGVGFASAPFLPALWSTLAAAASRGDLLSDSMGVKLQVISIIFSVGVFFSTLFLVFTIEEPERFQIRPPFKGERGIRGWCKRRLKGFRSLVTYPTVLFLAYYVHALGGTAMVVTMIPFYTKFNLRSDVAFVWGPALASLGPLVTVPLWIRIMYRREKSTVLCISLLVMVLACGIGLCIPDGEDGLPVFFLAVAVLATGAGGYCCSPAAMKPDICDYDELRSQSRREGRLLALWLCSGRLFSAVGMGLSLSVLAAVGFDPEIIIQEASVLNSVRVLTFGPPLIAYFIAFLVMRHYPIRRRVLEQIQTSIEECKKGGTNVTDPLRPNCFLSWRPVLQPGESPPEEEENDSNGTELSIPIEETRVTDEASRSLAIDRLKASVVDDNPEASRNLAMDKLKASVVDDNPEEGVENVRQGHEIETGPSQSQKEEDEAVTTANMVVLEEAFEETGGNLDHIGVAEEHYAV